MKKGTTVGSKEDGENKMGGRRRSRGGKGRREGDHEVRVGSKVGLKDRHYGAFKCSENSYHLCGFMHVTSITLNL